jgi:hypothetical protein
MTDTATGPFSDPGADVWTGAADHGDGSGAQPVAISGQTFSLSHRYTLAGTFTVQVTISDDDQESATATAQVAVLSPIQATQALIAQVNALVSSGVLRAAEGLLLNASLQGAERQLQQGREVLAVVHLQLFITKVNVLVAARRLTQAQGAALVSYARRIVTSVGD